MSKPYPVKIGEWIVNPELNLLVRGSEEVVLVPRVMQLLLCLVEHAPGPVSQDKLFAELWPGQVVSDASLYQAVAQLRKALGDTGKQKTYIERVSGKGYRLVMPVKPGERSFTASSSRQLPSANSDHRGLGKLTAVSVVIIALGLLAAIWGKGLLGPSLKSDTEKVQQSGQIKEKIDNVIAQIDSVALIRLELQFITDEYSPLAAFNDLLLTQLGYIEKLKVISLDEVVDDINVDAYLTGRLAKEGSNIRVYLRLEDRNSRQVIWAKLFTGKESTLFELQDEVMQSLQLLFDKRQQVTFSKNTIPAKVFEQYLMARYLWEKRTEDALLQARSILEGLKAKNKLFPLAAVALCETYHYLYIYSDWDFSRVSAECQPLLEMALTSKPDLGQALAAKGLLSTSSQKYSQALVYFERAIALSPNYALGYLWYGNLLRSLGQYKKALTMSKKAFELAPMSPVINRSLAYSLLNLRDFKQAKYYYERALTLEPDYIHRPIGDLDFFPLTVDSAKAFLVWARGNSKVFERNSVYRLNLAQVWIALGELEKAEKIIQEFEVTRLNPGFTQYVKASLQIARENLGEAVETFEHRLELTGENERVFVPYVQALAFVGKYPDSLKTFLDWFPEFNDNGVAISERNFYHAMLFIKLVQANKMVKGTEKLASQIDLVVEKLSFPVSMATAEWLVFRGQKDRARSMISEMMQQGWLPDTNAEPFALVRMRQLHIDSGFTLPEFEQRLEKNRLQVLSFPED
ncbi:winged helix-turn-helix domain-containing protein [Aliikangiella sp. G2MR2-5]|uniref:winged helix-turn-helix domain-containing protein n=1 Tax=Aliikangiella sp. G2MR2-5 TaxID=2788943 RepID=UPI0018AC8215|nr:winged helix-turn-helix domain-containing protein [Aliikangiella sp. G2MR2-5]